MATLRSTIINVVEAFESFEDYHEAVKNATPYIEQLLKRPDLLTTGIERTGYHVDKSSWLYYDPDLSITIAQVPEGKVIPVHDHGTWEIVAPYRGVVDYTEYRRVDDGSEPGSAALEVVDQRRLMMGDIATCPPPPNDVHGWTVKADTYLLAVVGPEIRTRRAYFDPDAQIYLEKEALWPRLMA